jgi:hypothetical protein
MRKIFIQIMFCMLQLATHLTGQNYPAINHNNLFPVSTITEEGAWCWFADPRVIHYENESGTINSTYIGYIDVHGYIKATQIDHLKNRTSEVMIRSCFQPDDHNNPTFLVLPDERIMIFYSRHTDEPCFYYRVSQTPGDITTLGKERKLDTEHNTTYPSPFILSDDPDHIYLCWRGIGWHPTVARLTIPDEKDNVAFDWGPYQLIRSLKGAGGVRPYAKYASNGKDKIYLAYTTTHPDNQAENWIYLNYLDIHTKALKDITGNGLSVIGETQLHEVDTTPAYKEKYPDAVVDDTPLRNWIWELTLDHDENPVMATVSISHDKTSHDYYHVRWTGNEWQKTFLSHAGGHFHQTPDIEKCYSGGMTLDKHNPQIVYGSVPVEGNQGKKYELKKFIVGTDGKLISTEQLTRHSPKNNVRPFAIAKKTADLSLVWMQGDYYDWIVSSVRPQGFPTAIKTNMLLPQDNIDLKKGLKCQNRIGKVTAGKKTKLKTPKSGTFTIAVTLSLDSLAENGELLNFAGLSYGIYPGEMPKPYIRSGETTHISTNVLGNSDTWQHKNRGTDGQWYLPEITQSFHLAISYDGQRLRTYINGLTDQILAIDRLSLSDIHIGGFDGAVENLKIYDRALSQDEIKAGAEVLGDC